MYGVPADLPLEPFIGDLCCQISIRQHQLQFRFTGAGVISVEGKWELRDSVGDLIDQSQEQKVREAYRIHKIIDVPLAGYRIDAPESFTLYFADGSSLTIYDDSKQHASFQLNEIVV